MTSLQPVGRPRVRSLWLQEALALEPGAEAASPIGGDHTTDICIAGGGYTGLWTALRIKELAPTVSVTLLEADICGSGASGRNGGLVLGWWAKLETLITACGESEALRLVRAASDAVAAIGRFCADHAIEAHFRQSGRLHTATTPLHLDKWEPAVALAERYGFDAYERLSPDAVAARAGSAVYRGGIFERDAATVQPALLARGLLRVARELGVHVHENSPVISFGNGTPVVVRTERATITAGKVILATNAWTASLQEVRRHIIVVSSDMVATAPIPERLAEIGWSGGESITDSRLMVHYHHVTHDGRIAIGRGGGALAYMGRVTSSFQGVRDKADVVERDLRKLYPALGDVPVTHRWGGPIDRSRSGTLVFGQLERNCNVLYGIGYSGTGVAQSRLGANILASTALERVDEWSTSRLNRGALHRYPPDPIRFFGGLAVRQVLTRKEEDEEDGIPAGGLATAIASLAYPSLPRSLTRPAKAQT